MAYPYAQRTRQKQEEVIGQCIEGNCSDGTTSVNVNFPQGSWAFGVAAVVTGNDASVVFTLTPYADYEQTVLSDTSYKFLKTGSGTASTSLTMASTSTSIGSTCMVVPAGDQYGAAAPIIIVNGAKLTATTAATTGTWKLTYTGVEI